MFSFSGEFIIEMVLYIVLGWSVLCIFSYLLKTYSRNKVLHETTLLKYFLVSFITVLFISISFMMNSKLAFDKLLDKINSETICTVINSELNRESGKYEESEIRCDKSMKFSTIKLLSEQKYKLMGYGYSLATSDYLSINIQNNSYIYIIGSDFVAFKHGIFYYRCKAHNKELLNQVRNVFNDAITLQTD